MVKLKKCLFCLCFAVVLWGMTGAIGGKAAVKNDATLFEGVVVQPHGNYEGEFQDWWLDSEVLVKITELSADMKEGYCYVTAFLPKELKDGEYALEVFVNEMEAGYSAGFSIKNGKIESNVIELSWEKMSDGYLLSLGTAYSFQEKKQDNSVLIKLHSQYPIAKECIVFKTINIEDKIAGKKEIELQDAALKVRAWSLTGKYEVVASKCNGLILGFPRLMEVGEELSLQLLQSSEKLMFTSSDSNVALISEDGVITAKTVGTVTITVTNKKGSYYEEHKINVVGQPTTMMFEENIEVSTYSNDGKKYQSWWDESEICVYMAGYPLKWMRGVYGASLYIPDYSLKDGQYGVGISLGRENSPYSAISYVDTEFRITNGILDASSLKEGTVRRVDGAYIVDLIDSYAQNSVFENAVFILKVHSDVVGENGKLLFGDVFFADAIAGYKKVDLKDEYLEVSAQRLVTGETLPVVVSSSADMLQFEKATGVVYLGESFALKIKDSKSKKLTYSSSNKKVATVSKSGKITAKSEGLVEITVKDSVSGAKTTLRVEVKKPYVRPQVERTTLLVGSTYKFSGVAYGLKNAEFIWGSSNKKVATIGKTSGKLKAVAEGKTKITVKDKVTGTKYSFYLEVYDVDSRDLDQYIEINTNGLLSKEMEQKVTKLLYEVYPEVFDYYANGEYKEVVCNFTNEEGIYTTWMPGSDDAPEMFISVPHLMQYPDDVDCITHELIHCAQMYPSDGSQVWLTEGMTDYGRSLFGVYNEEAGWALPEYQPGQNYTDSYRVTAAFLKYVVDNHNDNMIQILNKQFKKGSCPDSLWVESTGYTIDELWDLYAKKK